MAVPFTKKLQRLPKGFQSVLKDIAREVLKNKPDNIYEFGSRYFDQCLRVRNANRIKDRFEKIQIPLLDSCIFHKDRTNFDKMTREVERAKIIPKAYAHRLAMAVCSCKRKKINIHVLMTEKNLQNRLIELKERVDSETSWSEDLMGYLRQLISEDVTLKQESICRLIYVLHEALFYNNYDLLTRAAITSNPRIRQHFIVKKHDENVSSKQKEEKLTKKPEQNLTAKTKLEQTTISVTDDTRKSNLDIVKEKLFMTEDDQLSENEIENIKKLDNLRRGEFCYRDIATIKIHKPRLQISEEVWFTRWQKRKISLHDSHTESNCLATDLKEKLADRFEIKVLSKQYTKRQKSFRKQYQKSVLDGGHCRNCSSAFHGFKYIEACIHHPGYIAKNIWTCCGSKPEHDIFKDHSESWCNLTDRHTFTPQKAYNKKPGSASRQRYIKDNLRKLVNPTNYNSSGDILHAYLEMFYI